MYERKKDLNEKNVDEKRKNQIFKIIGNERGNEKE